MRRELDSDGISGREESRDDFRRNVGDRSFGRQEVLEAGAACGFARAV